MERNELDMLSQLLEEDDFAKGIAMGLSSERAAALGRLRAMQPWQNERYSNSDIGNGFLFADFHKDTARFVSERKCWFIYDGSVWRADVGNLKAMEKCKELATLLFLLTAEIKDAALRDVCIKRASRWHNRGVRETILKDAASVYCLRMEDFDRDHYLFNCLNGTLNLRTGEFREHCPEDLLTMMSGVNYDKEARCPRWERFMTEIMVTGTVKPEQVTLADAHRLGMMIQMSSELVKDAGVDMSTFLSEAFAEQFASAEENAFLNGNGMNMPKGLLASGSAETGVTAQTTDAITAEEVISLYYSLDEKYRQNAVFMMHEDTAKALRLFKDENGHYLWREALGGEPDRLLGRPVYISRFMPKMAAGVKPVLFGDLSKYWIGDRGNRSLTRYDELFADQGQTGYRMIEFVDGKLILPEAVKVIQMAE